MNQTDSIKIIAFFSAAQIFEEQKNIFDCLTTLVATILNEYLKNEKSVSFIKMQKLITTYYNQNIPSTTLESVLENLNNKGVIQFIDRQHKVTLCPGEACTIYFASHQKNIDYIDDFFIAFEAFLRANKKEFDSDSIKKDCCQWLYANTLDLINLIGNNSFDKTKIDDKYTYNYSNDLIDFLLKSKEDNSIYYSTFLTLYNGALQASLLNFVPEKINDLFVAEKVRLSNIILDSNFLLRILNLQSELESTIAKDTVSILKSLSCHFYILDQTLIEIISSIKKFLYDSSTCNSAYLRKYTKIKMTGLWEAHRRGIPRSKFALLVNKGNLRTEIQQQLSNVSFIDSFDDTTIPSTEIDALIKFKNNEGYITYQAKHDLALIKFCQSHRKSDCTLADAQWWVLTNDEKLAYWNFENSPDVQECLTETQLGNLLWIQNERTENIGLMETMLSLSSNNALSSKSIMDFTKKVTDYIELNKTNAEKLDKLSLVFAQDVMSNKDIKSLNDCDGFSTLEKLIEEKSNEIEKDKIIQEKKLKEVLVEKTDLSHKNDTLASQNDTLASQNDTLASQNDTLTSRNSTLASQNSTLTSKYSSVVKELISTNKATCDELNKNKVKISKDIEVYTKLTNYVNLNTKLATRIVCFLLLLIFLAILVLAYMYILNMIPEILLPFKEYQALTVAIIGLLLSFIMYIVTGLLFGIPMNPSEFFTFLRKKVIKYMLQKYMRKEFIQSTYITNNELSFDENITSLQRKMKAIEEKLKVLEKKLKGLEKSSTTTSTVDLEHII